MVATGRTLRNSEQPTTRLSDSKKACPRDTGEPVFVRLISESVYRTACQSCQRMERPIAIKEIERKAMLSLIPI